MAFFNATREDLGAGQIVVVIARWLLIATGFAITLWSPIGLMVVDPLVPLAFCAFGAMAGAFYQLAAARGFNPSR
jgi:hypothetical protein